MNKITGVSDGSSTIPVSWTLGVEETYWHNAIIMATTISRRIDTMNLWDGTLSLKEKVSPFAINAQTLSVVNFNDTVIGISKCTNGFTISETIPLFAITAPTLATLSITDILPVINSVSAYNNDTTTIIVEFDNPIYCSGETVQGFTFTQLVGLISNEMTPITVEQINYNKLQFTFTDFSSANTIVVIYNNDNGNLVDNASGISVNYFAVTFSPTMTYSEGE